MLYIEHIQQSDECVLTIHTCVCQPALLIPPLRQTAVVKVFLAVLNDKRNYVVMQALLQSNQPPHSPISILEGIRKPCTVLLRKSSQLSTCYSE